MALNLTNLEKKAIAKVLLDIVNADNKVSDSEVSYFRQLQLTLGISNSDIQEAKSMNAIVCLSIIKGLTFEEKAALAIMMVEMINADGHIDDDEMKIFVVVCSAAELPLPSQLQAARV